MYSSLFFLSLLSCEVLALWPAPQSLKTGSSVVWIDSKVQVTYNGGSVCWTPPIILDNTEQVLGTQYSSSYDASGSNSSQPTISSQYIVQGAISRSMKALFEKSIVPWKLIARNELSKFEPAEDAKKTYIKTLTITQTTVDTASTFTPLAGQVDESYNITIGADGSAQLSAVSSTGVLHGLESFIQLFYQHSSGGIYTNLAPISIIDAPKFSHRGLNMDVSRNWYPVKDILRTIDAISMNKFNRLHIHMTDSQSWPMDIPSLPELSKKGAYMKGLFYSTKDIQTIQTYALQRGIEVIIEFDMPGHTTAIGLAYPDLIAGFEATPWDKYCAEPPCGSLKLNSPAVYDFLEKLFDDVLPRVKPYSAYFHTGGDEVNSQVYLLDETVKSNDSKVIGPLIQKLVDRNHAQVRAAGLTPIVWEEMALQWNLTLGSDVLVQTWQSDEAVAAVTAKGLKALAGNYNYWV